MTARPPAVIIAGGQARRMGGSEKALLPLGGATVLDYVLTALEQQAGPLAVNANGDAARWAAFGLPVLPDPVPDQPGPLAGILAAMLWAKGLGAAHVLTVAGDTPFVPETLVRDFRASGPPPCIAAAPDETGEIRLHPVCGLWPVDLEPRLQRDLGAGMRRVAGWAQSVGARQVAFPAGQPLPFFNINTPEDLARAEAMLTGA